MQILAPTDEAFETLLRQLGNGRKLPVEVRRGGLLCVLLWLWLSSVDRLHAVSHALARLCALMLPFPHSSHHHPPPQTRQVLLSLPELPDILQYHVLGGMYTSGAVV